MKLEREKNAKRNIVAGSALKVTALLLPFVLRTVIIQYIGVEYAGVNTLFSSLLNVLSLAELGFGTAIVYSMYKPIANNETEKICSLLNYYKNCYRIIGSIVLVVGIILLPFIPHLIDGDIPDGLNIYLVYSIYLVNTSISYFMFAYKSSVLIALQRNDISSWISLIVTFLKYGLQIFLIVLLRNYYWFLLVLPLTSIINNICIEIVTRKKYPQYYPSGIIDKQNKENINKKVKSLFIYKVGNVVSNSADSIVISSFLGLSTLAIYGNYYFVISSLFGFLAIYYDSIRAGLGNKIALESNDSVFSLFKELFFLQGVLIGWMTICLLCLYQDFITVWLHNERLMLSWEMVILLCLYFYSWAINDIVSIFKEAAGLWEYDRFRPLLASLSNLIINIVLVNTIGLYGVVISTIVCELTFSLLWGVRVLFTKYFTGKYKYYLGRLALYTFVNILVGAITYFVCDRILMDSIYLSFVVKILICCMLPTGLFICIYYRSNLFRSSISRIKRIIIK